MNLEGQRPQSAGTLGAVLYPDAAKPRVSEEEWVRLVRAVARDDALALQALYEKAHQPVFTLAMRIACKRATAEEVTLDVFDDVWRRAASYSIADGTVLGWIMNLTRARTLARLRSEQRRKRGETKPDEALLPIDGPDYSDLVAAKEQASALKAALAALTPEECGAIEEAFFAGRDAARPLVREALHKLGSALAAGAEKAWSDHRSTCKEAEQACAHALQALSGDEARRVEAHLGSCWQCRRELDALRPLLDTLVAWPTDVLRPPVPLQPRLAARIAAGARGHSILRRGPTEPAWEDVAPGISCKILATDPERHMVSMLVRLVPGGEYPPHTHAGVEELHLLAGELWIDDRKLHPGDYNRAEPGTGDKRVWSETGCACVLVTSTRDVLA